MLKNKRRSEKGLFFMKKRGKNMDDNLLKKIEEENNKPSTHLINTPEREEMRYRIKEEILSLGSYDRESKELEGEIKFGKRLDIVIGLPAAGKSSALVNPISAYYKSQIIDSDMAKERIPEFNGGIGANRVHPESKIIFSKAVFDAIQSGRNIVTPIVGKSIKSIENIRKLGEAYGYECHLHINELPLEKAIVRSMERYKNTGRYISPEYIIEVGTKPRDNFLTLKESGKYESYSRWSNDVEFGEKPILLESYPDKRGEKKFMFTKEELDKVDQISIYDYVVSKGFHVKKTGKDYKIEELGGGCYIDIDENKWYWFNKGEGGKLISFVMELENKQWVEAVKTLLNMNLTPQERKELSPAPENEKLFLLPKSKKKVNPHAPNRAYAYLVQTRKLDKEIVGDLMKQGLIYEDVRGNAIFVGKDKEGNPKYAFARGTNTEVRYMGEVSGSDKKYSFSLPGKNNTLYITESAIDLLSYQTLLKKHNCMKELEESHFLSLAGVNTVALDRYLSDFKINKIVCCLDNDEAGKEAVNKIAESYGENYQVTVHMPKAKDFNMQLTNEIEELELMIGDSIRETGLQQE